MVLRLLLFLVLAVGTAGFGTIVWLGIRPPPPAPVAAAVEPPAFRSMVLAATRTLRPGSLIRPDDLTSIEFPPNDIPRGARRDTPQARAEVLGAMVRHTLGSGQVVLPEDIVRAGDHGFLAAVLAAGKRAVAIGVDSVSGTAGLIWPGDRVDVILTQALSDQTLAPGRRVSGETVLQDVRVIAIDQDLAQGATPGAIPGQAGGGAAATRTITLEVLPAEAERIAVAKRLGQLSLSVVAADVPRPDGASDTAAAPAKPSVTWGGDVSTALQGGGTAAKPTLRVFLGKDESKDFHF